MVHNAAISLEVMRVSTSSLNVAEPKRCRPRRVVAVLLVTFMLTACQSLGASNPRVSPQPLTAIEVRGILVNHMLSRSGGPLWRRWEYGGVHRSDGTMTGRVSWFGGDEVATGVWEMSPDDLYCRAWGNEWGAGQRGCFRVSRAGETLVFDHVSGSRGDANRYVYRLLPR